MLLELDNISIYLLNKITSLFIQTQSDGQPKREAWMMELPDCMGQNIGLAARTFRVNAGPDLSDRSMWTDSPADRARKEKVSPFNRSHLVHFLLIAIFMYSLKYLFRGINNVK